MPDRVLTCPQSQAIQHEQHNWMHVHSESVQSGKCHERKLDSWTEMEKGKGMEESFYNGFSGM
jgi:hypothetical protein